MRLKNSYNIFRKVSLKGVFAKIKGSIGLRRKVFYGDCYLFLSVASIRRKLLKTTNTEEPSVHTN